MRARRTELTEIVHAPALHRTRSEPRARVVSAECDLHRVVAEVDHFHRFVPRRQGTVAEESFVVSPPAPHRAIAEDGAAVVAARRHRSRAGDPRDQPWRPLIAARRTADLP